MIDLSGMLTVDAIASQVPMFIKALAGGKVLASRSTVALNSQLNITADGLGSLVNVSNLAVHRLHPSSVLNPINAGIILIQHDNRPPVAQDDTIGGLAAHALDIHPQKLLKNDVDPDGDLLSLTLPGATTTQGGSVTLVSGRVHCEPPPGYEGPDTFDYVAHDGFGLSDTAAGGSCRFYRLTLVD